MGVGVNKTNDLTGDPIGAGLHGSLVQVQARYGWAVVFISFVRNFEMSEHWIHSINLLEFFIVSFFVGETQVKIHQIGWKVPTFSHS